MNVAINSSLMKAIGEAMMASLPQQSAIFQPVFGPVQNVAQFRADILAQIVHLEKEIKQWRDEGQRRRVHLWSMFNTNRTQLQSTYFELIESGIVQIERNLRDRRRTMDRFVKSLKRQEKEAFSLSPLSGEVVREVRHRLSELSETEFEEILDFSLFLRAVLAEYSPDKAKVNVFSEPDRLDKFLGEMGA